jgi:hypothetical protein
MEGERNGWSEAEVPRRAAEDFKKSLREVVITGDSCPLYIVGEAMCGKL